MKKEDLLKAILGEVPKMEKVGKRADKLAKDFLDDNEDDGITGVAVIVFNKIGCVCGLSYDTDELEVDKIVEGLRQQANDLEVNLSDDDDDDDEEDKEDHLAPSAKMVLSMMSQGLMDSDGTPTKKLIRKAFKEIGESPKRFEKMTNLERHKLINKVCGSPLSEKEIKKLARQREEYDDED